MERLDQIEGEIPDPANLPTGCAFRPRCRWATEQCATNEPILQQVEERQLVACFESKAVSDSVEVALQ
jgi:oligopeptide/dipeptide ABC transporter ATP-binding protein